MDTTGYPGGFWPDVGYFFTAAPIDLAKRVFWDLPVDTYKVLTPTPGGSGQIIPGSTGASYIANMATGQPTDAQIAYNQNTCVQATQNMPGLTADQRATAIAQCATDQQAYLKIAGGTAQQVLSPENLLAGVLPDSNISTAAWLILGAVVGLIVLTRR